MCSSGSRSQQMDNESLNKFFSTELEPTEVFEAYS